MRLDHTIIPSSDKEANARFYADCLGLKYCGDYTHFIVVKMNSGLKLLFDTRSQFEPHHYAFQCSTEEYDAVLARIKKSAHPFGDSPVNRTNSREYFYEGDKGFYFDDKDGHILEVITQENS